MNIRLFALLLGVLGLAAATVKVFEETVQAGVQPHTSYYANGQKKESTRFWEGHRHGHTVRWYPDGSLKAEGSFVQGRMDGEWTWMTPEGELDEARSGTYEDGQRVSS